MGAIPTSHGGALWRPPALQEAHAAGDERLEDFEREIGPAVIELVRDQVACGLSCVNDGEVSKRRGYSGYARERLSGLEQRAFPAGEGPAERHVAARDKDEFPGFFQTGLGEVGIRRGSNPMKTPTLCVGPVEYAGQDAIAADLDRLRAGLEGAGGDAEGFVTAVTPGTIEHWLHDHHYGDDEAFMFAIADAMAHEYRAIIDAGFVLQLDDPDIADGWQIQKGMSVAQYREYAELRVEAINRAVAGLPPDRIRLHVCWGSGHGPHKNDLPLAEFVDLVLRVDVGTYMLEAANPRHEHEWTIWKTTELPGDKRLMPGVVGHAADHIEHPELVAQRLLRFADCVGPERIIAGTDCGLGYRVGHPEIQWAKLDALVQGARLASERATWSG